MRARKKFGQHFLEAAWAEKVVEAIRPASSDRFVEIGAGPGALTLRLAPRVGRLTAIEVDRELATELRPKLPANVDLVEADILDVDLRSLAGDGPLRVAGNLPYNISSPILFKLLAAAPAIVDATVMVQREVAERLEATPGTGEYGPLSISIQLHADVTRVLTLPPGAFRPPPKVHSAVVRLSFRPPRVALTDERLFIGMVRSMFTQRRKTLANALSAFAETHGRSAPDVLAEAQIDPRRRPETLTLDELARLAARISAPRAR